MDFRFYFSGGAFVSTEDPAFGALFAGLVDQFGFPVRFAAV